MYVKNGFLLFIFLTAFKFTFSQSDIVETICFKSKSFSIDSAYSSTLKELIKACNSENFCFLRVFSFADTTGTEEYNDVLSEKRALALLGHLNKYCKIDSTKYYVTWIGESSDAYDLHFSGASIQKRCVDIWVSFCGKKESGKE